MPPLKPPLLPLPLPLPASSTPPSAAALFATGWPYEGDCGPDAPTCWLDRDARFWRLIEAAWEDGTTGSSGSNSDCGAATELPLYSDFSVGCGRHALVLGGRPLARQAWYNLSLQARQPRLLVQLEGVAGRSSDSASGKGSTSAPEEVRAEVCDDVAFSGGGSVRLSGRLKACQLASVQLFSAEVQLPAAGLWVRCTLSYSDGAAIPAARLALRLTGTGAGDGSGGSGNGGSFSTVELVPRLLTTATAATAEENSVAAIEAAAKAAIAELATAPWTRAAAGPTHVALPAMGCIRLPACRIGPLPEKPSPAGAAAAAAEDAPAEWETWQFFVPGPAALAAAAGAGDGKELDVQLTGLDLLLLNDGGYCDGNSDGGSNASDGEQRPRDFAIYLGGWWRGSAAFASQSAKR